MQGEADVVRFYPQCNASCLASSAKADGDQEDDGSGWASKQHLWNFITLTTFEDFFCGQGRILEG